MDFKEIKELIKVFDKSELNKLKVKDSQFEIALQKGFENNVQVPVLQSKIQSSVIPNVIEAPLVEKVASSEKEILGKTIDSPMIGTFYASPSPEAPEFVKVGDKVKKGQTLCILEAMKIMNEVEAEFDCKIVDILVEDGKPVEYDMPLFVIETI